VDPGSELQALLSAGEGQRAEFKRQLPGGSDDSKRTVFKTVAAFANGDGGTIVFGVEKDEATVCGLGSADPRTDRDRLIQLARSTVVPAPDLDVRHHDLDGKMLLVLTVPRGANPPYGITLPGKKDKPVEFYVRRGATTFPASPDEIRAAVLATVPPQPSSPPRPFPRSSGRW
jgi:predicted HTH transcriptional regulator